MKLVIQINSKELDREKRVLKKQFCYLWKMRNTYCKTLYYHSVDTDIDKFEHVKFIKTSLDEYSILFGKKHISDQERKLVQQYISAQEWIKSAHTKYAYFINFHEERFFQIFKNNRQIYILMLTTILVLTELIFKITVNGMNNIHSNESISKTKKCIQRESQLIKSFIEGGTKRDNEESFSDKENVTFKSPPLKKQKLSESNNKNQKKQYHLEPNALKVVQQSILNMPDTCSNSWNRVVFDSCVPLTKVKQMRKNMLKNKKYKDKFQSKGKQLSTNKAETLVPKHNSLYSYINARAHAFDWS
eukprot:245714_1